VLAGAAILIVDDDHLTRRSLERVLKREGASVVSVSGVRQAKSELMRDGSFDAAVVDLRLVDGSGASLVALLRATDQPCCALIITGAREASATREALDAGADDLLHKPFKPPEFIDAVLRTIAKTRAWRQKLAIEAPSMALVSGADPDRGEQDHGELIAEPRPQTMGVLKLDRCASILAKQFNLTAREQEILVLLFLGRRNVDIAEETGCTERTVKFHVANIFRKMGVESRGDLLRFFF
jgi:DNA-binding NarL/FixJ family response regulator